MFSAQHKQIFGVFAFLCIILLGFFVFQGNEISQKSNFLETTEQNDLKNNSEEEVDDVATNTPLETKTNRVLNNGNENLEKVSVQDEEKYMEARKNIDEKKCDEIEEINLKNKCYDEVFWSEGVRKNEEKICTKIAHLEKQTACLDEVRLKKAMNNKNFSVCAELKTPRFVDMCTEESERNIMTLARSTEECEKISNENLKNQCNRQFLTEDRFHFSPEKCWNIADENDRFFCEDMVLKYYLNEKKSFECGIFSEKMEQKCDSEKKMQEEREIFSKAMSTKDVRYCNQLSDENKKQCVDIIAPFFAFEQKDIAYCNVISDSVLKEKCVREQGDNIDLYYFDAAKNSKDKNLCEKIKKEGKKEKCFQDLE